MKLSVRFPELGTMLLRKLLKRPGVKDGTRGPVVNVATVELIYQLGKKQDSSYEDRCGAAIYNLTIPAKQLNFIFYTGDILVRFFCQYQEGDFNRNSPNIVLMFVSLGLAPWRGLNLIKAEACKSRLQITLLLSLELKYDSL